jgi:hypothetical protein
MIASLKTAARRGAVKSPAVADCPDFLCLRQHAGDVIDVLASLAGRPAAELARPVSTN